MASSSNKSSPHDKSRSSPTSNKTIKSTIPAWMNLSTIPEGRPSNLFVGGQDQDHDDADWVWVDEEEVMAMVDEEIVTKMEEVVTLKDNHFPSFNNNKINKNNFQSDEHKGFVSLSDLFLSMDGYDSGMDEEIVEFMEELRCFYTMNHIDPFEDESLPSDQQLNLLKLWRAVTKLGGFQQVTTSELWGHVGQLLRLPSAIAATLPSFYEKTLLGYEKFKLGNGHEEQNPDSATLVSVPAPDEFQEHYEMMGSKVPGQMSPYTWANRSFMD
ncbi:AT-rich interactive domain-containing protein 3 [Linum perenne]